MPTGRSSGFSSGGHARLSMYPTSSHLSRQENYETFDLKYTPGPQQQAANLPSRQAATVVAGWTSRPQDRLELGRELAGDVNLPAPPR